MADRVPGHVIAVDVGGTTMKGARVDAYGRLAAETVRSTPADEGPAAVVAAIERLVGELAEGGGDGRADAARAVGVVVPGVVDADAGIAVFAGNLGWRDVPLRERLAAATGLPVAIDHDVRTAGLAERTAGALRGVGDGLLVVLGTGIAAVLTTGRGDPVRGARGIAGELGHIPVWPGGEPCPCGQRGCLERYASAAAIARAYASGGGARGLGARDVAARLGRDAAADAAWARATDALAIALVTCTMLLDPAAIVLGGGLSEAGAALCDPVTTSLAARLAWREPPRLSPSPLGARGGVFGAALLAWDACGENGAAVMTPAG